MPANSPHEVWRAAITDNLLDGCWITQHYGDSLGYPMAMLTVGPGDPVLSQESYWGIVGQASGLGDLSCLDHTKLGEFRRAQCT